MTNMMIAYTVAVCVLLAAAYAIVSHLEGQLRVLEVLRRGGEWYGAHIAREAKLGRAGIYLALAALEDRRLIVSSPEPRDERWPEGTLPRRLYRRATPADYQYPPGALS